MWIVEILELKKIFKETLESKYLVSKTDEKNNGTLITAYFLQIYATLKNI